MLQSWKVRLTVVVVLSVLLLVLIRLHGAAAQTIDPHRLYEQRCAGCHEPHARDLAKATIEQRGGVFVGKSSGRPLETLLANHRGTRLSADEIKALAAHLAATLQGGGLFQEKCMTCHDRAVVLARTHLTTSDGRLVGRYSGRDIATFLAEHGRLTGEEAETILAMLERQLATREP